MKKVISYIFLLSILYSNVFCAAASKAPERQMSDKEIVKKFVKKCGKKFEPALELPKNTSEVQILLGRVEEIDELFFPEENFFSKEKNINSLKQSLRELSTKSNEIIRGLFCTKEEGPQKEPSVATVGAAAQAKSTRHSYSLQPFPLPEAARFSLENPPSNP